MTTNLQDIARLLTSDTCAADGLPDLLWARSVLSGKKDAPPERVDPDVAGALLETLVERSDGETVSWLAGTQQKAVAKLARRAVHKLRARKMEVPLPAWTTAESPTDEHAAVTDTQVDLPALLTGYDGAGYRAVWVPKPGLQGVDVLTTELSLRHGVISYEQRAIGRKKYRGLIRRLKEEVSAAASPAADALWLVHQAVRISEDAGRPLPVNFLPALREMGPAAQRNEHPVLALEPLNEDLEGLYALKELQAWLPERDVLQRLSFLFQEIQTSKLYLNEAQREAQWEETLGDTLTQVFDARQAEECRRYLLDSAHLLACRKELGSARRLRAAADLFSLTGEALVRQPFVRQFLERFVVQRRPGQSQEGPAERRQGSIILP